jgi:putative hemolysin
LIEGSNLFLLIFLVLANGFFVAAEFALVGVRRSRIATLTEAGDKGAQCLLRLVDNLNAFISATQLGITLSSLALGWIGEPAIAHLPGSAAQRLGFGNSSAFHFFYHRLGEYFRF